MLLRSFVLRSILKPMLAEAGRLQYLEQLQLSNLGLDELPAGLCSLKRCKELQLQNNELPSLPEEIGAMSSLRSLDLSNNKLTSLPASMVRQGAGEEWGRAGSGRGRWQRHVLDVCA